MYRKVTTSDPDDREKEHEWRDFTENDFKDIKKWVPRELTSKLREKHYHPQRTANIDVIAGVPSSFGPFFVHSAQLQTFERHCLFELLYSVSQNTHTTKSHLIDCFVEIVTKGMCLFLHFVGLIYREMKKGTAIMVYHDLVYVVRETIASGKGFTAIILEKIIGIEDTDSPMVLICVSGSNFHPSGLDALSSYISDIEPYLGHEAMESVYDFFVSYFKELFSNKNQPIVWGAGHSLGGALIQQLVAHFPSEFKKIITFQSPGVSRSVHARFRNGIDDLKAIDFEIHYNWLDFVPYYGGYHLGLDAPEWCTNIKTFYWTIHSFHVAPHAYFCTSNPSKLKITVKMDDNCKIATNMASPILEALRSIIGFTAAPSLRIWRWGFRALVPSRTQSNKVKEVFI